MLAEYGLRAGEYGQHEADQLALAWIRRKRFEAMLVASELAQIFSGKARRRSQAEPNITADEAWQLLLAQGE